MKYKFRTKPYKHQVEALKRAVRQHALAVFWEPGTGKTKLVVDWSSALHQMGALDRVLVVCPLSVIGVWEDEYEIHSPTRFHIQYLTSDTTVLKKCKANHLDVVIANYDIVWRRKKIVTAYDPQMVVADESHRIKKPSTRRSWYMRSLNKKPYRAILTGTPTPRSFLDLYGQFVFLNPKRFGTDAQAFKDHYLVYGGYMHHEIRGYKNVGELKGKVKQDATIRRKDQCLDLPERVWQRVPIVLEPQTREKYETLANEFFLELKSGAIVDVKNAVVKLLRLQQITGGFINTDQGIKQVSKAKLVALRDLLEDRYDEEQKVVIFARFRPELEAIEQIAQKVYRGEVYRLDGKTPREHRSDWKLFQRSKVPSVFLAQIQSGGLGIQLQSAHEAIFYSVTHALDDYIQAGDRLHRSGQVNKVIYRHLVGVNTVDVDIYAALRRKENVMKVIMGDPKVLTRRLTDV